MKRNVIALYNVSVGVYSMVFYALKIFNVSDILLCKIGYKFNFIVIDD